MKKYIKRKRKGERSKSEREREEEKAFKKNRLSKRLLSVKGQVTE